jgi:hypothetical protein
MDPKDTNFVPMDDFDVINEAKCKFHSLVYYMPVVLNPDR